MTDPDAPTMANRWCIFGTDATGKRLSLMGDYSWMDGGTDDTPCWDGTAGDVTEVEIGDTFTAERFHPISTLDPNPHEFYRQVHTRTLAICQECDAGEMTVRRIDDPTGEEVVVQCWACRGNYREWLDQ